MYKNLPIKLLTAILALIVLLVGYYLLQTAIVDSATAGLLTLTALILVCLLHFILVTQKHNRQNTTSLLDHLEYEKKKFDAILSSMKEGLVAFDGSLKVVLMNQAASVFLRVAEGDARGRDIFDVLKFYKGESPVEKEETPIYKGLDHGVYTVKIIDDFYLLSSNDKKFPITMSISLLLGENHPKNIRGVVMFRDVTVDKDVDKAKTEFVSLASHQLRTPLSAINWYTEMLLDGDAGKITAEQKKYLEEIYHGNRRMVELVNALLNVSRLELGTFAVDPEPTDLTKLIDSVIEEQKPKVNAKKINLKYKKTKNIPIIQADPKLLRMVYQNLLSNATKYTPEKGSITIEVSFDKEKNKILSKVSDTGWGIPKEQQGKIFSKLFRADNVKEHDAEGTGLGLYIIESIIKQAGGLITFESEENKGTTFFVSLPVDGMKKKEGGKKLT